ncbi:uncharacterized protein LOC124419276 [Lucilia cuprina]|uniref:uncharacterized protein LOC124419276 n=1 Tax=Lucilia cuprina TaxID=7375 RepID=UPI001F05DED6|nr:uncharacterized protein LOC124419276 [Lucilia cuprina]
MLKLLFIIVYIITKTQAWTNIIGNNRLKTNDTEQQFSEQLLINLYQRKIYKGVLIFNENDRHQYCNNFLKYFQFQETPMTIITANITKQYRKYFNNQIICIVCMTYYQQNILDQLAMILYNMRYTRIIILIDQSSKQMDLKELNDFFKYSYKLKMLNVVVFFKDLCKYVQFTIFPKFELEFGLYEVNSSNIGDILPDRLRDLKGYKLRTLADHYEPRSMEYYNEKNETILNGYIARYVQTISEALNASLYFPLPIPHNKPIHHREVIKYTVNSSLDIPISIIALYETDDLLEFSYPVELIQWSFCLASCKKWYSQWHYRWPEIVINDMAIRGVLGQSFVESNNRKLSLNLINTMLMLCGLTVSTVFGCYLLTFCTQPPLEPEIKTYQDLAKSPLKVGIYLQEFLLIHNMTNGSLAYLYDNFVVLTEFADFTHLRDTFDRRYTYYTTSSKLYYYQGLESYYNTKIYRYDSGMCVSTMMQLYLSLGPNSYFLPRVDEIIMNIMQSGLMNYWISCSYRDG